MRKLLLLLCFIAPVLAATPPSKVLIIHPKDGNPARAIVGEMRITARSITYDAGANRIVCEGDVKLGNFGGTATTERLNVQLPPNGAVFFLNEKGIEVRAPQVAAPAPFPTTPVAAPAAGQ